MNFVRAFLGICLQLYSLRGIIKKSVFQESGENACAGF